MEYITSFNHYHDLGNTKQAYNGMILYSHRRELQNHLQVLWLPWTFRFKNRGSTCIFIGQDAYRCSTLIGETHNRAPSPCSKVLKFSSRAVAAHDLLTTRGVAVLPSSHLWGLRCLLLLYAKWTKPWQDLYLPGQNHPIRLLPPLRFWVLGTRQYSYHPTFEG